MARTIDTAHREALVEAVASQFVAAGTARTSLRDLAEGIDTSARMLVHHFGGREQLVGAALDVARARQLAAAEAAIRPGPDAIAVLGEVWDWFEPPQTRRYFALFSEVAADERSRPDAERRFAGRLGSDWQPLFEGVFAADARFARDAPELARLVIGVLRGFALELDRDGSDARRAQAFALFVDLIDTRGTRP